MIEEVIIYSTSTVYIWIRDYANDKMETIRVDDERLRE